MGNSRSSRDCARPPWSKLKVVAAGVNTHFCHVCSVPAVASLQSLTHLRRSSASVCTPIHDFCGRDYLPQATILVIPWLMGYPTSSTDSLTLPIPPDTTWNGGLMVLCSPSEVEEDNPCEKVISPPYFDLPVCQSRSKKLRATWLWEALLSGRDRSLHRPCGGIMEGRFDQLLNGVR